MRARHRKVKRDAGRPSVTGEHFPRGAGPLIRAPDDDPDGRRVGVLLPLLSRAMAHADCPTAAPSGSLGPPGDAVPLHLSVRRKIVYFTVGQREEVAVFEDETPSEDVKSKPPYLARPLRNRPAIGARQNTARRK